MTSTDVDNHFPGRITSFDKWNFLSLKNLFFNANLKLLSELMNLVQFKDYICKVHANIEIKFIIELNDSGVILNFLHLKIHLWSWIFGAG